MVSPVLLLRILLTLSVSGGTSEVTLSSDVEEDLAVVGLVQTIFSRRDMSECGLVVSTDAPRLSRAIQNLVTSHNVDHLPVLVIRMTTFPHSYRQHTYLNSQQQMYDFDTLPPDILSDIWSGLSCTMHLLLSLNVSNVQQLIVHTATITRMD